MDGIVTRHAKDISREELYELVWQTPLSKLGPQLAMNGPSLAALCRKRQIPTPPLGYWQKKAVGRAPDMPPLPSFELPQKTAPSVKLSRVGGRPPVSASVPSGEPESASELLPFADDDESLDHMRALHPKVKAWVAEHRQLQESRRAENRQRTRDFWGASRPHISDLTSRDRYRFRVTSTLFHAVEKQGGKIGEARLTGKVTFLVSEQELKCAIAEKMSRPIKVAAGTEKWTAFPHHHQTGLVSSGFLRVRFDTYVNGRSRDWIETSKKKMAIILPDIVSAIIAAGPLLAEEARKHAEWHRRYEQEQTERRERQRQLEIDHKRWRRFQEHAENWRERERLLVFIAELHRLLKIEGDTSIEGRPLSEWIDWAEDRT
jgi:hypothetical protein